MLISARTQKKKKETDKSKRELKSVIKRLDELERITTKLYEDVALGKITEERYQGMISKYEEEQSNYKTRESELKLQVTQAEETYENIEKFINLIEKYIDIQELNTMILNELIERIVVYEKTENPDGSKSQRVDIYYKFVGYVGVEKCIK